ncbi:MAG: ABC transporter permease, partial [Vicinamibacteria bacterium]
MLFARLGAILGRRRFELDLDEELHFHLDMEIRKNVGRGMDPVDAKLEAERAFGGVARVKEDLRAVRGLGFLDTLVQDLRSATRMLRRTRGFTFVVVLTLALGIGVNTAMFSVVREVLLRPLPHLEARGLVLLTQSTVGTGGTREPLSFSVPELSELRSSSLTLESIVEYHSMSFTRVGETKWERPERVDTGVVSAAFFDVLGVRPLYGRTFRPGEDEIDAAPVVLLGYEYWQRRYGGDPGVVGRDITMNDRAHRIVGVLPLLPRFPEPNDVFMPVSSCPFRSAPGMREDRASRMLSAVARLRAGASIEAASEEISRIAARMRRENPEAYGELDRNRVEVSGVTEALTEKAAPVLLLLFATTFFVLLIACSNASHLTLGGLLDRRRELALRAAIGGSRARIVRQILTESVLLALIGAGLGLACAWVVLGALVSLAERLTPRPIDVKLDLPALFFSLGLALAAGLAVGALAAFLSRRDPRRWKERTASPALIVAQVAVSLPLLLGAGLTLTSLHRLSSVETGVTTERVLAVLLDLDWHQYHEDRTIRAFHQDLLEKLSDNPAISSAAIGRSAPLYRREEGPHPERFVTDDGVRSLLDFHVASPEYFRTLGVPVVAGRPFMETDDFSASPVAIVN